MSPSPALAVPETPGVPGLVAVSLQSLARHHLSASSPPSRIRTQVVGIRSRLIQDGLILRALTSSHLRSTDFQVRPRPGALGPGHRLTSGITVHQPSRAPGRPWYDDTAGAQPYHQAVLGPG